MGIVVLPASMSRAGLIALAVSGVVFALTKTEIKSYLRSHKWLPLSVVAVSLAIGAGAFCLKKDSALGRFHIWEMELRAIADKPLTGHGYGNALGSYGDAQAEYYEGEERGQERVRIAGCPEYAFNEYLRLGMEFGILGLLLSVAVIVLGTMMLCHSDSSLTFGLVAWGTFAMASYPLAVWQLRLLLAVFLGAAIGVSVKVGKKGRLILVPALVCLSVGSMLVWLPENKHRKEAESKWLEERRFTNFGIFDGMADRLAILYPQLRRNFRYLYDYGYALHKECRYEESNVILREGALISSDPMFYNIIGKNHEALGDYELAERNYIHAHNMVPSRLYPYILLMEMEEKRGDTKQALSYARKALSLPVNDRNMSMRDLHNRAKKFYDEHSEDY
uniref:O-antigen ligase family protein n=1 Tax=Candidatus Cryptobacteroides bacterium TaxID=3085639 RepID=UPI0040294CE9